MKLEHITRLPIPRKLSSRVARVIPSIPSWYGECQGVDLLDDFDNLEVMMTRGFVDWHDDADISPYTALLIIRNTFGGRIEARGEKPIFPQGRGDLFLLNTGKPHRLFVKDRDRKGLWMAAFKNYGRKPARDVVLGDFKAMLKEFAKSTPMPISLGPSPKFEEQGGRAQLVLDP